ncbi:uracil-xanthine permease family protein [Pseudonocardia sp.]|jgi:uracil-xanthine permease|uniref:uracil-xanthine permease family protein n=1 Tax=Pseudonocardia sp. TaxID=60912 RepID=UPI003D135CCB
MSLGWKIHADGRSLAPGGSVAHDERLTWPRTFGLAVQHVGAMFGPTFVVPLLMGLDARLAVMMSGVTTIMFLLVVRGRVPAYVGTSGAFVGAVAVVRSQPGAGSAEVTGAVLVAGVVLVLAGLLVHHAGAGVVNRVLPPVVTGAILVMIGFNLAPVVADTYWPQDQWVALTVMVVTMVCAIALRGFLGRIAIFLGLVLGYVLSWVLDRVLGPITSYDPGVGRVLTHPRVDWAQVREADWIGLPSATRLAADGHEIVGWHLPSFSVAAILVMMPATVAVAAGVIGHVKAIGEATGTDLDPLMGRSVVAIGLGTAVAGSVGGSPVTTYGENIGVMAATRVFSSATFHLAGAVAILFGFCPKFGALFAALPGGVMAGSTVILYGMIGLLGAQIWKENGVDFGDLANMVPASAGVIIGIGDTSLRISDSFALGGIALGTIVVILGHHLCRALTPRGPRAGAGDEHLPRILR